MAYQGFLERPITGWGQEGFNYVFEKFYNPALYSQEPWFDRAHNAFIDWLVAGGLPAFLLYIALFGTALTLLWSSRELSFAERTALTAALVGYAIHNLFVFDNLYSYVYFFAILALIDSQVGKPLNYFEKLPEAKKSTDANLAFAGACVGIVALIAFINYPGMRASSELIAALSNQPGGAPQNVAIFQDLVLHPSFAAQEVREQLVSFAQLVAQSNSVATDTVAEVTEMAVGEMNEQVTEHPGDARTLLELSLAYRTGNDAADSLKAILAAEAVAPNKEQIYIEEGVTRWDMGDATGAAAAFAKAYALGPQFTDLATYAAAGDFITGQPAAARAILQQSFGTTTVDSDVLGLAYYRTNDYPDLIRLWQLRAGESSATADTAYGLAAAYYIAGQKGAAIAAINAAMLKYPSTTSEGAALLSEIQSGASIQ